MSNRSVPRIASNKQSGSGLLSRLSDALSAALRDDSPQEPIPPERRPLERKPRRVDAIVREFRDRINACLTVTLEHNERLALSADRLAALYASGAARAQSACNQAKSAAAATSALAGATQEMSAANAHIVDAAGRASANVVAAAEASRASAASVHALQTGARDIGEIIAMISAIAGQTSLL